MHDEPTENDHLTAALLVLHACSIQFPICSLLCFFSPQLQQFGSPHNRYHLYCSWAQQANVFDKEMQDPTGATCSASKVRGTKLATSW